jgi:opacity protein-like surface antigen
VTSVTRWIAAVGFLLGSLLAAPVPGASAQERMLQAGTVSLGLVGGFSFSHEGSRDAETDTVNGIHVLPQLGILATDEVGAAWARGNLAFLAEPTLIRLDDGKHSSTVGGLAVMGRWLFRGTGTLRPYLEAGVGLLGGETDFRQTSCDTNYIIQGGPGVLLFVNPNTALGLGYRFQHLSNAGSCDENLGLNSSVFLLGLSYFFQ